MSHTVTQHTVPQGENTCSYAHTYLCVVLLIAWGEAPHLSCAGCNKNCCSAAAAPQIPHLNRCKIHTLHLEAVLVQLSP